MARARAKKRPVRRGPSKLPTHKGSLGAAPLNVPPWATKPPPAEAQFYCDNVPQWKGAFDIAVRWMWYAFEMVDRVWQMPGVSRADRQEAVACLWNSGMAAPWPVVETDKKTGQSYFLGYPYLWYWFGPYNPNAYPQNVHHLGMVRRILAYMLEHVLSGQFRVICGEHVSKFGPALEKVFGVQCSGGIGGDFDISYGHPHSVASCSSEVISVETTAQILIHEIAHMNPLPDLHHNIWCAGKEATYYGTTGARFLVENCPEQTIRNPDNFRFFCTTVGRAADGGHLNKWGDECKPPQVVPPKTKKG